MGKKKFMRKGWRRLICKMVGRPLLFFLFFSSTLFFFRPMWLGWGITLLVSTVSSTVFCSIKAKKALKKRKRKEKEKKNRNEKKKNLRWVRTSPAQPPALHEERVEDLSGIKMLNEREKKKKKMFRRSLLWTTNTTGFLRLAAVNEAGVQANLANVVLAKEPGKEALHAKTVATVRARSEFSLVGEPVVGFRVDTLPLVSLHELGLQ